MSSSEDKARETFDKSCSGDIILAMEKLYKFEGLMAPVFTPFSADGQLNTKIIPAYGKYLTDSGIHGVLVNGTTGEGMSMSVEERQKVTEIWKDVSKSTGLNVMVQVGGAPFPDVVKLAAHADRCQVDSILCLPDLYNKPKNVAEVLEYLQQVSNAAPNTPLLYYHIPAFTNVNISITDLLSEAHNSGNFPRLAGAKFTHINLEDGASSVRVGGKENSLGPFSLFLGSDEALLGAFALGFNSAIGTTFNIIPEFGKSILSAAKKNDFTGGQKAQWELTKAIRTMTKQGGWVPAMKAVMNFLTPIDVGPVRFPLKPLSKDKVFAMKEDLLQLGIMKK
ncbi:hypothetical protein J437_LFUL009128 [Ladona fulva]|uniref:N-acetylneuraminate lyase n=1 Tax=Ladona fulva TaxID=123851 RepID=A0A8K0K8K4_LADFU|nr:hypothetical protein J437_LFUL009128 [Ladona fulva]